MKSADDKSKKMFYTMGEVAEMFDVNHSLLRFWEQRFDILKPKKNKKGNRLFTPADVKNLEIIYYLVKEKGMTLAGAEKRMKENREGVERDVEVVRKLQEIKSVLLEIKEELKDEEREIETGENDVITIIDPVVSTPDVFRDSATEELDVYSETVIETEPAVEPEPEPEHVADESLAWGEEVFDVWKQEVEQKEETEFEPEPETEEIFVETDDMPPHEVFADTDSDIEPQYDIDEQETAQEFQIDDISEDESAFEKEFTEEPELASVPFYAQQLFEVEDVQTQLSEQEPTDEDEARQEQEKPAATQQSLF